MTPLKLLLISAATLFLTACGGHGYEGTWKASSDNDMVIKALEVAGADTFILGPDYIEANGERRNLEIFTRESDGEMYLVMKDNNDEQAFVITKEDKLAVERMGMRLTYSRAE